MKEADESMVRERLGLQKSALTDVKLLSFMALVAMEQNCILPKHFENISKLATECQYLLAGWIRSDKRYINSRVVKKDFL